MKHISQRGATALLVVIILAMSAIPSGAGEAKWEQQTDFQKRLKPTRLPMVEADFSGTPPPADPLFLADRLAIINHVTAYSFLIDEGRWDQWFALFSDDILFETTVPGFGTIRVKGKEAFRKFVDVRYRGPGSETNAVAHRHTMGNVHVASQTADTAEVRTYLLISNAYPDGKFEVFTSGTYNVSLEKRDGEWTITRWYIEIDAMAPPSEVAEYPGIEFIPDVRPGAKTASTAEIPQVETIDGFTHLYRFGNFYIGGQPSIEELEWLKEQGVTTIINLRTDEEMEEFARQGYDEEAAAEKLGLTYHVLPVKGIEGYSPENLEAFIGLIAPETKTLIQCLTARRATDFFVAYLIRKGNRPVEEALEIGRRMNTVFPLVRLLGGPSGLISKK